MRSKARTAGAGVAAALLAVVAGGCSDGNTGSSAAQAPTPTVSPTRTTPSPTTTSNASTRSISSSATSFGRILVDDEGRTVYLFAKDTTSKVTCTGECAQAWPPLIASGTPKAAADSGVRNNLIGTTSLDDGTKAVTYNGHPLYRFSGDRSPGDVNGQGLDAFGARWYVVGTSGNEITTEPGATASPR